jgi:hypothetical protein
LYPLNDSLNVLISNYKRSIVMLSSWTLLCAVLTVILLWDLLFSSGLLYSRDFIFPYDLSTYTDSLSTWNDLQSQRNLEINKIPIFSLLVATSGIFGSEAVVKMLLAAAVFLTSFMPFFSIFLLLRDRIKSISKLYLVCAIPSILYLLNPWVVDKISNHIFMVFGMALTPLILITYAKMLDKGANLSRIFLSAILFSVFCMLTTHGIFYVAPILLFESIFYLIVVKHNDKKRVLFSSALFFAFFITLSSYWILPIAYESIATRSGIKPSYEFSIMEVDRLSQLNTPSNVFQMIGGGGWEPVLQFQDLNFSYIIFLIPIFSFTALLFFPRNVFVLFLGTLFVILFPIALGTNSPIPIYDWLLPLPVIGNIAWIYRDPSRIIQFLILIYSLLLAFTLYGFATGKGVNYLKKFGRVIFLQKERNRKNKNNIIITIFGLLVLGVIISSPAALTFFNGAGNRLYATQVPSEFGKVAAFLDADKDNFRILWVPYRDYFHYDWNDKGDDEVAGNVYSISSPKPTYGASTASGANSTNFMRYIYDELLLGYTTKEIGKLLSLYNVKYIIVFSGLQEPQDIEVETILQVLSSQKDMKQVSQFGPFHIFENNDYYIGQQQRRATTSFISFANATDNSQASVDQSGIYGRTSLDISPGSFQEMFLIPNSDVLVEKSANGAKGSLLKWETTLNQLQERYGLRLDLANGRDVNAEAFDELKIKILPEKSNSGTMLSVTVYTNASEFFFNRYNIALGEWNEYSFDMRAAKLAALSNGEDLNLNNVTGIGLSIFSKYYNVNNPINTFYIKGISLVDSDQTYGAYDLNQITKNWPKTTDKHQANAAILELSPQQQKSPSNHHLEVKATEPYILAFAEAYDPLWVAKVKKHDGTTIAEYKSVPLYNVINGFQIDKTGEYQIEIVYKPQQWLYRGAIVSVSTLFITLACLILLQRRRSRRRIVEVSRMKEVVGSSHLYTQTNAGILDQDDRIITSNCKDISKNPVEQNPLEKINLFGYRILIGSTMILLLVTAIILTAIGSNTIIKENTAILAYYFLTAGVIWMLGSHIMKKYYHRR